MASGSRQSRETANVKRESPIPGLNDKIQPNKSAINSGGARSVINLKARQPVFPLSPVLTLSPFQLPCQPVN